MSQVNENADDLLAKCKAAHLDGEDFPRIWHGILRRHPLVLSHVPVQVNVGPEPVLQIQLITGQSLLFQNGSFSLG